MVSCTEHIPGKDQHIDTYLEVLITRAKAFAEYMAGPDSVMDECDWDDEYKEWLQQDQTVLMGWILESDE